MQQCSRPIADNVVVNNTWPVGSVDSLGHMSPVDPSHYTVDTLICDTVSSAKVYKTLTASERDSYVAYGILGQSRVGYLLSPHETFWMRLGSMSCPARQALRSNTRYVTTFHRHIVHIIGMRTFDDVRRPTIVGEYFHTRRVVTKMHRLRLRPPTVCDQKSNTVWALSFSLPSFEATSEVERPASQFVLSADPDVTRTQFGSMWRHRSITIDVVNESGLERASGVDSSHRSLPSGLRSTPRRRQAREALIHGG